MQLTIPQSTTGFYLRTQLLKSHVDTNYVLLYNNKGIDGNTLLNWKLPKFVSLTPCGLGIGGR